MPRGFIQGRGGCGGGMGFGFRGSSPTWPYVGRGRGGLPRCGYYSGTGTPLQSYQPRSSYSGITQSSPYSAYASGTVEDEISYMKDRAEKIKEELGEIESKIKNLENKKQI